jgi:hypothetical protein
VQMPVGEYERLRKSLGLPALAGGGTH